MNHVLSLVEKERKRIEVYDADKKERKIYDWMLLKQYSRISSPKKVHKINSWLNTEKGKKFLLEGKTEEAFF